MSDIVELGRRLKRSLDGYITYRKAAAILILVLVFFLYLGPGLVSWLLGSHRAPHLAPPHQCVADRVARAQAIVEAGNGHTGDTALSYVGNGYIGLEVSPSSLINIKSKRTLSIPVSYKPLVEVSFDTVRGDGDVEEAEETVTDYVSGVATTYKCLSAGGGDPVTVTSTVYAHRTLPGALVQDIKIYNPTARTVQLAVERRGIAGWDSAVSTTKVVESGEGGAKHAAVTGTVEAGGGRSVVVAIVSKKLPGSVEVRSRSSYSLHLVTGVAYTEQLDRGQMEDSLRGDMEKEAIATVKAATALSWQNMVTNHSAVWRKLWTSGFGISYSYAENAINGDRINATIYYVLSHSPTLLDSAHTSASARAELSGYLSYTEGCYSGIRTLQARNLWTPLTSLNGVDTVVSYWLLNLEKNGCHNLVKAGADGVMQAMVLSLPGLKFSNHHLELNVHPRELHRDLTVRRVNYGNETHINISVHVMEDNKAAMFLSLDKRDRDYYACDAGCLDPPVKLGPDPSQFPVKLTEPVTAILYVTADHEHMNDLKHTIHVVEKVARCQGEMSLGLLTGYGSGSESDNEEESQTAPGGDNTQGAGAGPLADRLRVLSDGGGVGLALTLPPPPPPEPEPLPNPMKTSKPKQKSIPGMSKKEMELLKNAKWMDITTEGAVEGGGEEFEYNTPLPFSKDKQPRAGGEGSSSSGAEPVAAASSAQPEYDYVSYVAEYQNYLAHSAALMQGQERARQLAEQAAEGGEQPGVPGEGGDEAGAGSGGQVWDEYMTKYAAWYAQYGAGAGGAPQQPVQPQLRQKTFEELLEQDRQLDNYFSSEPPNEYNTQRDAFKSSFRGTRRYRMLNGGNYNAKHFNTLSSGAKKFAEMYPKQKSVIEDKDAYVADKDLPENQDIKSNKQRKKDKWFQGMVEKKKGCKKCGFVFCRCYGWEFKPSHVK